MLGSGNLKAGYFIFIIILLGFFSFLVSTMPRDLIVSGSVYLYNQKTFPSYFTKEQIEITLYWINDTVNYAPYNPTIFAFSDGITYLAWFGYGGHNNFFIDYLTNTIPLEGYITNQEKYEIEKADLIANIINMNGTQVSIFYGRNRTGIFANQTSLGSLTIYITDPNTVRNDVAQAWEDGLLMVGLGKGQELNVNSGWDLLAKLLTFQQIQGIPIWISYSINLLIWGLTAYCVIFFILEVLPEWM